MYKDIQDEWRAEVAVWVNRKQSRRFLTGGPEMSTGC